MEKVVEQTLFTLVNLTKKHREDGDKERLKTRIESTLRELCGIADELENEATLRHLHSS